MKRIIYGILAACLLSAQAFATDCIPSGVTDQYTYFVAVDSTDHVTRETGLSTFTVYRSRNGAAAAAFTTPTVNETSSANMPGVYELLLDEDMTIDSGDDVQHMTVHITATGMAPVTKEFCIARAKVTAGETLTVSGGNGAANVTQFGGTNGTFSGGRPETNTSHWGGTAVASARPLVDAVQVSGDSGAADALEAAFDGTATGARLFGIDRLGTAAAVAAGTITLDSGAAYGDNTLAGATVWGCGSTQGYCQFNTVASNVGSTDVLTLSANWPVTPSGTVTYYLFGTAASTGGGGLDAAGVRSALGMSSANLDTQLAAIDDYIDTEIGTITTRIGTPSNLGGGATVAANLSDIEAQTDDIGAAGAGLTAADDAVMTRLGAPVGASISADIAAVESGISWNSAWDAEIESEANDAIVANHLDHLLAADYDPSSKPGVATALLNELIENDGGVSRFTANALEQGPAGGGGSTNITQIEGADATDVIDARIAAASLATAANLAAVKSDTAAILVDTGTTLDGKIDTIDSLVDAIKLKTDQLTFGVTNTLNVNVEYQNAAQLCGDGSSGDKWRACP